MFGLESVDHLCEVALFTGPDVPAGAVPDLFIELPHGATEWVSLDHYKPLCGAYPGDRHDLFFWANTDQGSPEYGRRLAGMLTDPAIDERCRSLSVLVLRCLVPRTILDVNRLWASSEEAARAGLTRGVPAFVTEEELPVFEAIWRRYDQIAQKGYELVCGNGGQAFNLHTYAPISVSEIPGEYVVDTLERAYRPDQIDRYPRRPTVSLITTEPGKSPLAPGALVDGLLRAYTAAGVQIEVDHPYTLHPATSAHAHASRHPQQTITIEISRAALVDRFEPFVSMTIDPQRVERMTRPLAEAILTFLERHDSVR